MSRAFLLVATVAVALTGQPGEGRPQALVLQSKTAELASFGACLYRQAPRQSAALLHAALGSPEEAARAEVLAKAHNGCVKGPVLSARTGEVHGAVAQAAFQADPSLLASLANRPEAAAIRPARSRGRQFLIAYASCLVTADPQRTAAFLKTGYDTPEEHNTFLAYDDELKACMPLGVAYQVVLPDLRNQIAALAWQAASPPEAK